ncbi:thiamine biosynthesis lipoprotein [Halpernia humi]|uniref:FAD:protein FMN transferase n=1 Tax=Halpernia humi TaxID=493375 RepID=A0A1H5WK32_9FLAO|nr:FAD:protein FMN transferase [Halpernia humi]SEF99646.1 thiamine biosynthesis lipoprotein [Halpernia humi]
MQKKRIEKLMGNRFDFTVEAENETEADFFLETAISEIKRIESKLTTFNNESETFRINENAGKQAVEVSEETYRLIERSKKISDLTQGAFDISYGSVDKKFWNFDTKMTKLPDKDLAKKSVGLINYKNIILNEEKKTVFLKNEGMRIGFGGIGKGYAAEKCRTLLKSLGAKAGIVNASGDLTTWGTPENKEKWTIGIVHPDFKDEPFSYLEIADLAVATSGNYEKFVMIGGKKYSHTIDPKTGFPVQGIKSVTIICPNAEISDALATPVTIMGIEAGLGMINQMKNISCIIIDDQNNFYYSKNINLL